MRKFLLGIVFFFGMAGMVSAGSGDFLVRGTNGGVVSWKKALESPVILVAVKPRRSGRGYKAMVFANKV